MPRVCLKAFFNESIFFVQIEFLMENICNCQQTHLRWIYARKREGFFFLSCVYNDVANVQSTVWALLRMSNGIISCDYIERLLNTHRVKLNIMSGLSVNKRFLIIFTGFRIAKGSKTKRHRRERTNERN